ncbi:hypothetical protein [Citrobacter koseri]|uniref:hypothetical protein n=1 Tax=Citrobacter koseri TaxID=545 RepID=UPI00404287C4
MIFCLDCNNDDTYLREKTTSTSWIIPTLMGWAVILEKEKEYNILLRGIKEFYPKICSQLWHPTNNLYHHLYFHQAQYVTGETEAPITFPDNMNNYQARMNELKEKDRYNIFTESSARKAILTILDFYSLQAFQDTSSTCPLV